MKLRALTDGAVTGTGTATLEANPGADGLIGGVLISTDGTNAAVVVLRRDNASGKQVFSVSTVQAGMITAPISMEGTATCYFSVTGTGASAQLFEWVP